MRILPHRLADIWADPTDPLLRRSDRVRVTSALEQLPGPRVGIARAGYAGALGAQSQAEPTTSESLAGASARMQHVGRLVTIKCNTPGRRGESPVRCWADARGGLLEYGAASG